MEKKALSEDEIDDLEDEKRNEQLAIYWCAKEAVYKLLSRYNVDFAEQIEIERFRPRGEGGGREDQRPLRQVKKLPMRMCLGCDEMKPKKELIRVVKSAEGEISLDLTGKKNGRGAYICRSAECLRLARKARRLEKSFQCRIDDEVYDRLESELSGDE